MGQIFLEWAMQILVAELTKLLTPEKVKEWEIMFVAYLRDKAKTTPGSIDDAVVEAIANALQVP